MRSPARDAHGDGVSPLTRWVALGILPFLVLASAILYILPRHTDTLFAWTITPPLTAMFLASAYIGGIWFFAQVLRSPSWGQVSRGYGAVLVFATLAGIATIIHWDRFHFWHISFMAWATLYVTTPVVIATIIVVNRGRSIRSARASEVVLPFAVRLGGIIVGGCALVTGVVVFVAPGLIAPTWAWTVTPLTARIVGAVLTLPGMVNLWMLVDARWSAFRVLAQAQLISLCFIVGALVIARGDLLWDRLSTWLFVPGIVVSLIVYAVIYVVFERRRARILRPEASWSSRS
ncbi:MAG TPA: hypothetical protein VGC18_08800 [Lacisediminihabitans sp.]|uniref:hypothetical protein n=1 Tax=Lacisediminihabitans sp. TaxID=2787631 RepID=UPI002ED95A68